MSDGGPAFPSKRSNEQFVFSEEHFPGMSLRDYFATSAMNSLMHRWTVSDHMPDAQIVARHAYEAADAMLKAREQP